jgi:hypothetical protein
MVFADEFRRQPRDFATANVLLHGQPILVRRPLHAPRTRLVSTPWWSRNPVPIDEDTSRRTAVMACYAGRPSLTEHWEYKE